MRYCILSVLALIQSLCFAQCGLTIEPDPNISGCMLSQSEAIFTQLVNTSVQGTTVQNTGNSSNWSAGAYSTAGVSNSGFAQTIIDQTNKTRVFGLSHTNSPYSNTLNSIDYAIVLYNFGFADIRESGNYRSFAGWYEIGDTIKIAVENNIVKYYNNSTLLYTSTVAPSLPLNVDLAFRQSNGRISDVTLTNTTGTTIQAFGDQIPANSTTYEWYQNNNLLEQTNDVIALDSFSDGDIITCKAFPVSGICSGNTLNSNSMTLHETVFPSIDDLYISGTPEEQGCFLAEESVIWNANIPDNMNINGGNVTKTQGYSTWNGGVYSTNRVFNNGYLEFGTGETNTRKMVGLSSADGGNSEYSIEYAFYLESGGSLVIYENGWWRGSFGSISPNDTMRIAVDNGVVKYFKNGNILYVSSNAPTLPLIADGTIQDPNATITRAKIANPSQGSFSLTSALIGNTQIEWKVNGQNTGISDANFTLENMATNDIVLCSFSIQTPGCGTVALESNPIRIIQNTTLAPNLFYIDGVMLQNSNGYAEEEVVWNPSSLANVSVNDNDLTKVQGYNQFNAGGSSLNTVKNGGYFDYQVNETNKKKSIGLSTSDMGYNYWSTDYAILLGTNGKFTIYESGSWRLGNQTYSLGDVLRISVEENVVKYYRNETLVYASNVAPTLPLLVDVGLSDEGGSIQNAVVGNPNGGKFNAHVSGLGASPLLEWKVNNNYLGINGTSLNYDQIANEDIITCTVTPDIAGCNSSTSFISNFIHFSGPQTFTQWIGAISSDWQDSNNWSYGLPNMDMSVKIMAGTPFAPIVNTLEYVKNIDIGSGTSLTITNEASLIVYGDFNIDGSFFPGDGKVTFNGANNRQIMGTNLEFNKLIINLDNAETTITLSSSISISAETLFIKGKIATGSSEVVYLNGSVSRSANTKSFIDGKVRKIGNTGFTFPVGSGTTYAPHSNIGT